MTVRGRLALGFGAVLALLLVVSALSFVALRQAGAQASALATQDLALANAASALQAAQLEQGIAIRDFVAQEDVAAERAARQAIARAKSAHAEAAAVVDAHAARMGVPELRDLAERLKDTQGQVTQKIASVFELVENAEYDRARAAVHKELLPIQRALLSDVAQLASLTAARAQERANESVADAGRALVQIGVLVAAALAAGILGTLWLARGITRPLGSAVAMTERVAEGDLTASIESGGSDETGRLLRALSSMQRSLHEVAAEIRDGAGVVSRASEEIAKGNEELSRRTEDQASSLEEVAASIEEITSAVKQTAENARAASGLAVSAAQRAEEGGRIVGRVVETMGGIQSSSQRMADIVSVIDGIAFQTNILALNAAVEAARAGDQGRGFAVVASEVRALAQRSATAAKEVKALIGQGVDQASAGAKLADEAGSAISTIISAAKDVSRLVADISRASQEQLGGVEQISGALGHMEKATQHNSGLVEETHAATQALLDQAKHLVGVVGRFRLAGAQAALPEVSAGQIPPPRKPQERLTAG